MKYHKAAEAFPMMGDREYHELKADIEANGVLEPAWTYQGKILDGRNRSKVCDELGIDLPCRMYEGHDPFSFVISLNLHRRHLNESQRSMIAARMANLPKHANQYDSKVDASIDATTSQTRAAALLHVSRPTVQRAKQVQESGDAELITKVDNGEMTVNKAVTELKKRENAERNEQIAAMDPGAPDKRYHVVVIDPPWPMQKIEREVRPNQTGLPYPPMTIEEIAAVEIPADDDCHLWLWTTHKFLPDALGILKGWSFKYVCTFVWHKPGGPQPMNLPQYNCEFSLYARRGAPKFVDTKAFPTCFNADRAGHSVKPDHFYDVVRRVTDGARLDMFNRREITGFDTWGKERERLAS